MERKKKNLLISVVLGFLLTAGALYFVVFSFGFALRAFSNTLTYFSPKNLQVDIQTLSREQFSEKYLGIEKLGLRELVDKFALDHPGFIRHDSPLQVTFRFRDRSKCTATIYGLNRFRDFTFVIERKFCKN